MTEAFVPRGEEPDIISVAPDIEAKKYGQHYNVRFPYDQRAVAAMKRIRGARYAPETKGWVVYSRYCATLEKTLREIDQILGPGARQARAGAAPPVSRADRSQCRSPQKQALPGARCRGTYKGACLPDPRWQSPHGRAHRHTLHRHPALGQGPCGRVYLLRPSPSLDTGRD